MSRFIENPDYDDDVPEENLEIPDKWYAMDIKNIEKQTIHFGWL